MLLFPQLRWVIILTFLIYILKTWQPFLLNSCVYLKLFFTILSDVQFQHSQSEDNYYSTFIIAQEKKTHFLQDKVFEYTPCCFFFIFITPFFTFLSTVMMNLVAVSFSVIYFNFCCLFERMDSGKDGSDEEDEVRSLTES